MSALSPACLTASSVMAARLVWICRLRSRNLTLRSAAAAAAELVAKPWPEGCLTSQAAVAARRDQEDLQEMSEALRPSRKVRGEVTSSLLSPTNSCCEGDSLFPASWGTLLSASGKMPVGNRVPGITNTSGSSSYQTSSELDLDMYLVVLLAVRPRPSMSLWRPDSALSACSDMRSAKCLMRTRRVWLFVVFSVFNCSTNSP
mmetsp:Transcript_16308/g.49245  ORF Transcript_16308/g.49245 Transcript_16308/m.49245 type:complete len:202 (-) Transcript_16308:586-1191(-)